MRYFILLGLLVLGSAFAFSAEQDGLLPSSNEVDTSVTVSSAVTPVAVTISSLTPTRIDTALAASLTVAFGANYKRASVQFQNLTSTNVYCGYSASAVSSSTGWLLTANTIYEWFLGKGIPIYCVGVETAALRVGGKGHK